MNHVESHLFHHMRTLLSHLGNQFFISVVLGYTLGGSFEQRLLCPGAAERPEMELVKELVKEDAAQRLSAEKA